MSHMTLDEWDQRIAPFLASIGIRAVHIRVDALQIRDWVKLLPMAPDWPTEAMDKLKTAQSVLEEAMNEIRMALEEYDKIGTP